MAPGARLRQLLPIVVAIAIIALATRQLMRLLHGLKFADVVRDLHALPTTDLALGALLVVVLYAALATYEMLIARSVTGPVSDRRAVVGALLAAPLGHFIGWGAVSGGAIRYRLYAAVHMRPLDIGKMVLLAAMPYPVGLGLLLGLSLLLQSEAAAALLHVPAELARSTGLTLLALHVVWITLVLKRRKPLPLGRFRLTLPPPPLTAVQYLVGIIEVSCGASILYLLLPAAAAPSFLAFVGIYVLSILFGLASMLPAGIGAFDGMIATLLPQLPRDEMVAVLLVYRLLLELVPVAVAVLLFAAYEVWWTRPAQRARRAVLERAARAARED
jgi:glycosyltransferase 2 family protein